MWKCNCGNLKELHDDEMCECGISLDLEDEKSKDYDLEVILDQIDNLVSKARRLVQK